jgi:hypothetical protein
MLNLTVLTAQVLNVFRGASLLGPLAGRRALDLDWGVDLPLETAAGCTLVDLPALLILELQIRFAPITSTISPRLCVALMLFLIARAMLASKGVEKESTT